MPQRSVGAAAADDVFEAVAHTSTKMFDVLLQVFAEVLPWPRVGWASRILTCAGFFGDVNFGRLLLRRSDRVIPLEVE